MLVRDLSFMEEQESEVRGGRRNSASVSVYTSANGGSADATSRSQAYGRSTRTSSRVNTRTVAGRNYAVGSAVASGVASAVTVEGRNIYAAIDADISADIDVQFYRP